MNDLPSSDPIAEQHLRELAGHKSKAYELLLALGQNPTADDSCFQSLARIVDRIIFNEIPLDAAVLSDLGEFLTNPVENVGSALAVLSLAVSEAEPDRARLQLLLAGYPKWLKVLSDTAQPHFLGILPNIAALLGELKNSGVESLIALLNKCATAQDCETFTGCVARYQETSGEIVLAAAELADVAIHTNARSMTGELMIAAPPDVMFESKEARELLPAMVKLKAAASGDVAWSAAVRLCIAVARHNHSSALHLARDLSASLGAVPREAQLAYLTSFHQIVEEAGISLAGYGAKRLPALFTASSSDRACEYVSQGVAIARRYGKIAAEEFFEQKTDAAKTAAPAK